MPTLTAVPVPVTARRLAAPPASRVATVALVAACLAFAVMAVATALGFRPVVLMTNSMQPVAPAGSLIIAEPVDPSTLAIGDILVMHRDSGSLLTHRIVDRRVGPDGIVVETRGDANASADPEPYVVVGSHLRARWIVPGAGRLLAGLRSPAVSLALIGVLAALVVVWGVSTIRQLRRPGVRLAEVDSPSRNDENGPFGPWNSDLELSFAPWPGPKPDATSETEV